MENIITYFIYVTTVVPVGLAYLMYYWYKDSHMWEVPTEADTEE